MLRPQQKSRSRTVPRPRPRKRLAIALGVALVLLVVAGTAARLVPPDVASYNAALRAQARLDGELLHAQRDLGIPAAMLQPIVTQEQQIAASEGVWTGGNRDAAAGFARLYPQVVALERSSARTLQQQADSDLGTLTMLAGQAQAAGYTQAATFVDRLNQATQAMHYAALPGDYAQIDAYTLNQIAALQAMAPISQHIHDFHILLETVALVGIPTNPGEVAYSNDLAAFTSATDSAGFAALERALAAQTTQVYADEAAALAANGPTVLSAFQARITQIQKDGLSASVFQRDHDQDLVILAASDQPAGYLALAQTLNTQLSALLLPVVRGQANADYRNFMNQLALARRYVTIDPFNGERFPAAYEYANADLGYGVLLRELESARTVDDYQQADRDITILTENLQALVDNLHDSTPHNRPHATDLRLMRDDGLMTGKVMVVSLREQTARFYDNGKLVQWTFVTTGRPELPTPPGLHLALQKDSPIIFTSNEQPGSRFYFQPTKVKYAIAYYPGGFFIHDAWWRSQFGPGTNLLYYDPIAFNGGSHGCINLPSKIMPWVYAWMSVGTPVIVY